MSISSSLFLGVGRGFVEFWCVFHFHFPNCCFQLMPTLIFFNAVISVLYYLGLVQIFIAKFGKFLSFCIGTSPIESVNAASNLFLSLVSDHSFWVLVLEVQVSGESVSQ